MARSASFHCAVVTPGGSVLTCEAKSAVFPAFDGEIGILPNHAPLLTQLGIGLLRVKAVDGTEHRLLVDGGFAQVGNNKLTLLTEQAQKVEKLDPKDGARLLDEARSLTVTDDDSAEARDAAYQRARVHRRLAAGKRS
jgi:F-type H+-transporting ATPase subunit epsilon